MSACSEGNWNPEHHDEDRKNRDALAARGYWQAFQKVKSASREIIAGANPGARARATHMDWYRELFQPCVAAGIVPAAALAGYRNDAVYLRTSRYVPPRWEAVRDAMPELFDLPGTGRHIPASARCLATGCSATSIHFQTATGAWRASS